jgi:hypothetical protein
MGEPEDIGHLVSYLVSKEASFITGERRDFFTSLRPLTSLNNEKGQTVCPLMHVVLARSDFPP